jgi:hypothetical protein
VAKERKSLAERRQAGSDAATSSKRHLQHQARHQGVADRAREVVLEIQHRQQPDYGRATQRFAKEAADVHAATIRFVNTEADTGLNFARIAARSHDAKKKARNRRNAREAYDSAVKRFGAIAQSKEVEAVHQKLAKLRKLLQSLGRCRFSF